MRQNEIIFLVSGNIGGNVFISQVDRALKFLEENELLVNVIWFQGPKSLVSRLIAKKEWLTSIDANQIVFMPTIGRPNWLSQKFIKSSLRLLLGPKLKKNSKIIIQSRLVNLVNAAIELRKEYPNLIDVIYEIRGVLSVEKKYIAMHQGIKVDEKEADFLKQQEKIAATRADAILCVSERFKIYLIQEYDLDAEKINVIPSCVDTNEFFYSQVLRDEERTRLNFLNCKAKPSVNEVNRFVVVYSGSMFAWQLPEQMVKIFSIIKQIRDDAYFLVLTNEPESILPYIKAEKISPNDYVILSVKHHDVHKYLMASDVGLLLREDHLVNNVASPIKFAEYIRCGLPVILTKGIGDLDNIVQQNKIGLVLDNLDDLSNVAEKLKIFLNIKWSNKDRERISDVAATIFSRENYMHVYRKLYLCESRGKLTDRHI